MKASLAIAASFWVMLACAGISHAADKAEIPTPHPGFLETLDYSKVKQEHKVKQPEPFLKNGKLDMDVLKARYKRPETPPAPRENEMNDAKVHLGWLLFFDPRLSKDGFTSCATCHNPGFYWTDGKRLSRELPRKTMSLLNVCGDKYISWNARLSALRRQAGLPMAAATGMAMDPKEAARILQNIKGYPPLFRAAYGDEIITDERIFMALEAYECTIISGISAFDRWVEGNEKAISEQAKQGFALFNTKAKCSTCHSGWKFSDGDYYDIGLKPERKNPGTLAQFKAVGLRDIANRPPYMHTGEFDTLEQVIEHYNKGGSFTDRKTLAIEPLNLSDDEKKALVAFLKTLSSEQDTAAPLPLLPR